MYHEGMFLKWKLHPKLPNKIKPRVNYWYLESHFGQLLRSSKMISIIVDNAKNTCWSVLQWIDDQRWVDGCRRPDDRIMKRWRDNWPPNYSHQIQQQLSTCVSSIFNWRQYFDFNIQFSIEDNILISELDQNSTQLAAGRACIEQFCGIVLLTRHQIANGLHARKLPKAWGQSVDD